MPKHESIDLTGISRVRSIDIPGAFYPDIVGIDAQKRLRLDFDRDANNLTPTPNFIENPEIPLGVPELYGGMRWDDPVESVFGSGFSNSFYPQQRPDNNFNLNFEGYE